MATQNRYQAAMFKIAHLERQLAELDREAFHHVTEATAGRYRWAGGGFGVGLAVAALAVGLAALL